MKAKNGKYAWTAKVAERGQIVIPKEARDVFNIKAGDSLLLLGDVEKGIAIVKPEDYEQLFKLVGFDDEDNN